MTMPQFHRFVSVPGNHLRMFLLSSMLLCTSCRLQLLNSEAILWDPGSIISSMYKYDMNICINAFQIVNLHAFKIR